MLGTEMSVPVACKPDGCSIETRDPCASPPCKRLKQAIIPFPVVVDDDDNEADSKVVDPKQSQEPTDYLHSLTTDGKDYHQYGQSNGNCTNANPAEVDTELQESKISTKESDPPLSFANLKLNRKNLGDYNLIDNSQSSPLNSPDCINKSPTDSPPVAKNQHGILRFVQPVTPDSQCSTVNSKTPPKEIAVRSSTLLDQVVSPVSPNILEPIQSPSPATTPANKPKTTTPKGRTPGRKLGVEEKLKREEERLRKQKEKEMLEKERLEKKQEKERLKAEKEREREKARQKKEQEKLEQLAVKKQREKERQEKKEQEEKERRERMEKKDEERRKREEEKKRKEDEKTLKIEEKRKKEEEETLKKEKLKNSFASFFIKKETSSAPKPKELVKESKFQPFELKPFMKLANTKPLIPLTVEAKKAFCRALVHQGATSLLLVKQEFQKIKDVVHQRRMDDDHCIKNVPITDGDCDVMIIENESPGDVTEEVKKRSNDIKPILLQFHDNYRPAYFGTWRKRSSCVGPRAPFKKDEVLMNYDVDSDDEWEEEEPGESLSNSEGEEEDNDNDNDDENDAENDGFFVPHGYLSDDEGGDDIDEEEMQNQDGDESSRLPQHKEEDRMQRQIAKQKAWETEMKRQFKPMKPVAIGCAWSGEIPSILKQLEACCLTSTSIDPCISVKENQVHSCPSPTSSSTYNTAMPVPEEAVPALIKLIHGNTAGLNKLVRIFRKQWTLETKKDDSIGEYNWQEHCPISKRQLERKIPAIAKKEKREAMPKARWYVHGSVLDKYKMEYISLPANCFIKHHNEDTSQSVKKPGSFTPVIKHFTQNVNSLSPGQNGVVPQLQSGSNEENFMDASPMSLVK